MIDIPWWSPSKVLATTECARLLVSYLLQSTSEENSKWRYKNVIIIIVVAHLGNNLNILPVISKHYPHFQRRTWKIIYYDVVRADIKVNYLETLFSYNYLIIIP